MTNLIYKKKGAVPDNSKWEYKGCYKDDDNRMIKNNLGKVSNK